MWWSVSVVLYEMNYPATNLFLLTSPLPPPHPPPLHLLAFIHLNDPDVYGDWINGGDTIGGSHNNGNSGWGYYNNGYYGKREIGKCIH